MNDVSAPPPAPSLRPARYRSSLWAAIHYLLWLILYLILWPISYLIRGMELLTRYVRRH